MQRFCAILLFNILGVWIRLKLIWQYWQTCCFSKGRGSTETPSKLFANPNALGQLTNHNTFHFSEGGPSSNPEIIEPFVPGWGERYCNNVNYVKNNAIFEPPRMRACSSTPPKQNQDFVKEHNRTPLNKLYLHTLRGILAYSFKIGTSNTSLLNRCCNIDGRKYLKHTNITLLAKKI